MTIEMKNGKPIPPILRTRKSRPQQPADVPQTETQPRSAKQPLHHTQRMRRRATSHSLTHLFVPLGCGMLFIVLVYTIGTLLVVPFMHQQVDQWHTGDARVSTCDLTVGHHGKSHFLTQFWQGKAVIIEFVGGNTANAHTYTLLVTTTADHTKRVITLQPAVVNQQGEPGKSDLILHITGLAISPVLYNTGDGFATSQP